MIESNNILDGESASSVVDKAVAGTPFNCRHQKTKLVWTSRDNSGNPLRVRQLRQQCLTCGHLTFSAQRHALAAPDTPEIDLDLLHRGIEARKEYWRRRDQERERLREEWRQRYGEYLQTNEWRERRRLVMERANRICEGCRQEPATQVHHLTYEHVGNEFLWELVAICRWCHSRYHEAQHG